MSAVVTLPARLDLRAAEPLAKEILAARRQDLIVDAAATTQLGTPGLQVLLAAVRTWQSDGQPLALTNASEAIVEQLSVLGLTTDALSTTEGETLAP